MNKFFKAGTAFLFAAFITFSALGFCDVAMAAENNGKTISVNGTGTIMVNPDTANVTLGVETEGNSVVSAKGENATIMKGVITALNKIGIKDEQISTVTFSIYPEYDYSEKGDEKIKGYRAVNIINIKTTDIDNTEVIIDTSAKAGANVNHGVNFSLLDSEKYYSEALGLAVQNAGKSAKAISDAFGVSICGPVKIVEGTSRNSYDVSARLDNFLDEQASKESIRTSISYDKIQVTARILAEYEFK